jgi:hypothetical protein
VTNRLVVFALSAVLALALAVPALGGPGNPVADMSASALTTAKKALKTAKAAQKSAKTAQTTANAAKTAAAGAQSTANGASSAANSANSAAGDAKAAAADAANKATAAQGSADGAKSTADSAKAAADAAKSAADAAQSAANAAQTSADNANANANTRLSTTHHVNSTAQTNGLAAIACDTGRITGGGYTIAGTDRNKVTVTLNSDYGNGWLVQTTDIVGQTATTWTTTANAVCATTS